MVEIETEIVSCTCCGKGIRDNAEENVHFGQDPYPDDTGYGMCTECGGDSKVKVDNPLDEDKVKKRLGWAACCFYEARFPIIRDHLTNRPDLVEKFDKMSYVQKVSMVVKAVEKGMMV